MGVVGYFCNVSSTYRARPVLNAPVFSRKKFSEPGRSLLSSTYRQICDHRHRNCEPRRRHLRDAHVGNDGGRVRECRTSRHACRGIYRVLRRFRCNRTQWPISGVVPGRMPAFSHRIPGRRDLHSGGYTQVHRNALQSQYR